MNSEAQHSLVPWQGLGSFVAFCARGKTQSWTSVQQFSLQKLQQIRHLPAVHLSIPSQWLSMHLHNKPVKIWFFLMRNLSDKLHGEVSESNKLIFSEEADGVVPLN